MIEVYNDQFFMKQAYAEALKARDAGEVPIGAVLVFKKQIIARAHNQTQLLQDVTAQAEMLGITAASNGINAKYLKDCTLFVTLEPCVMCAAALRWAQISKLVYAAEDPKQGYMRYGNELLHPKTKIHYGLLSDECSELMREFFKTRRKKA